MNDIKYILFDAANTLIHKPDLWEKIISVLADYNIEVDKENLKKQHKILSDIISFPDVTSSIFYRNFNAELMYMLGVIPTDQLLNNLFKACSYLPWMPFDDTSSLDKLPFRRGILSNFNSSLTEKINQIFPSVFSDIIISEDLKCAKPNLSFYERAIEIIGEKPEQILYIGDSIKLDMEPALKLGMKVYLIDRLHCYDRFANRISSMDELYHIINNFE